MRIFNYEIEFQSSTPGVESIYLNFEFFFDSTTKELMKLNMVCLTSRFDRIEYGVHRFKGAKLPGTRTQFATRSAKCLDIKDMSPGVERPITYDCDQLKQTLSSLHINEADQRRIMDEFMNQFNEFNLIFPGEK